MFRKKILPRLRSLDVVLTYSNEIGYRGPATERPIPSISDLSLPNLEILTLDLQRPTGVEWASVEPLTSSSVIPNLRHCTLVYELHRPADLRSIFTSSLFTNDQRTIRLHFAIRLLARNTLGDEDLVDLHEIRSGYHNEAYCEYVSRFLFDQLWYRIDTSTVFKLRQSHSTCFESDRFFSSRENPTSEY